MKTKVLNSINNFVNILFTMFKVPQGEFAKKEFPKIVDNFWNDNASDAENLKAVKDAFQLEKEMQDMSNNRPVAMLIESFQSGWLNKIAYGNE